MVLLSQVLSFLSALLPKPKWWAACLWVNNAKRLFRAGYETRWLLNFRLLFGLLTKRSNSVLPMPLHCGCKEMQFYVALTTSHFRSVFLSSFLFTSFAWTKCPGYSPLFYRQLPTFCFIKIYNTFIINNCIKYYSPPFCGLSHLTSNKIFAALSIIIFRKSPSSTKRHPQSQVCPSQTAKLF